MKRTITLEQTYDYPPARVWQALTDPAALRDWLMENDFAPRVGHKFTFRAKPQGGWNGIVDCEVLTLDEPRVLAYSWRGRSDKKPNEPMLDTVVTWTLHPIDGGQRTRVVLVHDGFRGVKEIAISLLLGRGWRGMLDGRLRAAVGRTTSEGHAATGAPNPCH